MTAIGDPLIYLVLIAVVVLGAPLLVMLYAAWRMGDTTKKDGKEE